MNISSEELSTVGTLVARFVQILIDTIQHKNQLWLLQLHHF